jgi:aspartate racemase
MEVEPAERTASTHREAAVRVAPQSASARHGRRTDYPRDKSVGELFEEVVAARPNAVALTLESGEVSYAELNRRANRLAHRLRALGVGPEMRVGCCLQRGIEYILAILAVLKAGGAYVPLDPAYPQERLALLIEDTRPVVMLAQSASLSPTIAGCGVPLLMLDEELASPEDDANPRSLATATSLAYVMYTSGSTGRPKGVMIEHRSIVRLVRNTDFCDLGADEAILQFAPIAFDASTFEIWGALLNGGRLVVMPSHASSLADIGRAIAAHGVTTMWLTAGLFHLMVEQRLADLAPLRQLLAGGDVLSARHVRMTLDALPSCRLINGYGPTENTTFTCCHSMRAGDEVSASVPIGRPIANTQIYILDGSMREVGPSETGELYAGGDGVARGYLNAPETTAEKFLRDPFSSEPGARLYRTGDLVRQRADGCVEFLGRVDNQVKILGHRIEPGEIEAALGAVPGIAQCCVIPHVDTSGTKRLVAYYVMAGSGDTSASELRRALAERLPAYMVPALFVPMAALPLSANGKVDRAALPSPTIAAAVKEEREAAAKGDALEEIVIALWRRVLQLEAIGLDENFFDLGGDSLLLLAVHSQLQKQLRCEIGVTELFEYTTARTLAKHLGGLKLPDETAVSEAEQRAERQRAAFARQRERRAGAT